MKVWITENGYQIQRILGGRSNVFFISNGSTGILVDCSPRFMWKKLKNRLNSSGVSQIDFLILTHAHFDHADNARRVKEQYGARVIIHNSEADRLRGCKMVIPNGSGLLARKIAGLFGPFLSAYLACESCDPDILIADRFELHDFGFNAYILHTPGHSPGSLSVVVDNEVALVGDTMIGVLPWSVYPPFLEDPDQLIQSWGKLLLTGCSWFIPSHGSANSRLLVEKCYERIVKPTIQ